MNNTVCSWILFLLHTALSITGSEATDFLQRPDFESKWMTLTSQKGPDSIVEIPHLLNEVPLLVDVRVLAIDGPNKGYMFQATGGVPRDDDFGNQYGGVVYVYNQEKIIVSAPNDCNSILREGSAIYTETGPYYTGPNMQASHTVLVKARAWRKPTLHPYHFEKHVHVKAGHDSLPSEGYIEEEHGLNENPSFVIVRLNFSWRRQPNAGMWMSDSVGANFVTYARHGNPANSYVVYGFNQKHIRAWIDTHWNAYLFIGNDGYQLNMQTREGMLEMYAWNSKTFQPSSTTTHPLGPGVQNEQFETPLHTTSIQPLTRAWARTNSGPNAGFMFPGSGALATVGSETDPVCSFGGLVYAHNNNSVRFWRPTDKMNSGLICVSELFGDGTNSQLAVDADVIVSSWEVKKVKEQRDVIEFKVENTCKKIKRGTAYTLF